MTITLDALERPRPAVEAPPRLVEENPLTPVEVIGIVARALTDRAAELQAAYGFDEKAVFGTSIMLMNVRSVLVGRTITSHLSELEALRSQDPFSNLPEDCRRQRLNDLDEIIVDAKVADAQRIPDVSPQELAIATIALELEVLDGSDLAMRALTSQHMAEMWQQFAQADVPMTIS